jgi:hypothetical protein
MANNIHGGVGQAFTIFASAARTATPDTEEFELPAGARYGVFVIDVTAATSTPSTVFTFSGVDRVSGKVYTILASAAIVGTGTTVLRVGPALTAAANLVANDVLPPVIRVTATHGNSNSQTYTVAGHVA